ncbi:hypothetical protein OOT46_26975 [Aquabacterium sp. A7-Y]|uniref:hypothetical protein n=1 Tax=Aquabacterium sp. A7-Y TaxID=1349605 RepID=UPI00223DF5F9|nr:hypothetical protein [Aquabacterium sp. A7-Y]MCW7541457.1 hypothetical protein [Aquabacterium sp. A7-Y]
MSRRATVEPEWLDAMLCRWGRAHMLAGGKGYPSVSPMFMQRHSRSVGSFEPTGYSREDFRELEAAIEALPRQQQAALIRAYRPWTAATMDEYYPCTSPVTWHRWLHTAAETVAARWGQATGKGAVA